MERELRNDCSAWPCECPAHDFVAQLLRISSTTGRDWSKKAYPPRPRKGYGFDANAVKEAFDARRNELT